MAHRHINCGSLQQIDWFGRLYVPLDGPQRMMMMMMCVRTVYSVLSQGFVNKVTDMLLRWDSNPVHKKFNIFINNVCTYSFVYIVFNLTLLHTIISVLLCEGPILIWQFLHMSTTYLSEHFALFCSILCTIYVYFIKRDHIPQKVTLCNIKLFLEYMYF